MDEKCNETAVMEDAIQKIFPDLAPEESYCTDPEYIVDDIVCIEVKAEEEEDAKICYIEVIHDEEDCSDKHVVPQNSYVPRKLFLEHDVRVPEVRDSVQFSFFEINDFSLLDDPYASDYRPPIDKIMKLISDLNVKNSDGGCYGVSLDYGRFDIEGLKAFEGLQLKDDVLKESIWFNKQDYAKPKGSSHLDMLAINEFQEWLLNFGSEDTVPVKVEIALQTRDVADLTCDRWINDTLMRYFSGLIHEHCPRTYIINFAHVVDIQQEVLNIQHRLSSNIQNGQILFISPIGVHSESDETFVSQECLHTSHYVFASFLFSDNKVRYADTLGLKMPSGFIGNVNLILSHFDVEPTYSYCHDPRGTVIEDEPRFISHTCTQYCSKNYPLQTCTNDCGVAVIVGVCIAATSRPNFVELFGPENQQSKFAYMKNISHYSHYLRLALMQFMVKSCIDLNVISDSDEETTNTNDGKIGLGSISQKRRKNTLNISNVSDLVQDAVLKYARSKEKPAMLLVCQMKSSGKLVTKSFPCSSLGQDDGDCVADIQSFMNSASCREWLSSYVSESSPSLEQSGGIGLSRCNTGQWSKNRKFHPKQDLGMHEESPDSSSNFARIPNEFSDEWRDAEPVRHLRRKNRLDISNVSDLICDAKLKFVKIKGKPALQLGCIIKSIGKSVTKSFPCSALGQDDMECVARIQEFINSIQCTQWLNGYMKVLKSPSYDDTVGAKLVYRKNYLDIRSVSHLILDARVRFVKCKGKPCMQLICQLRSNGKFASKIFPGTSKGQNDADSVALVQKFLKSSGCITWLCNCKSRNVLNIDKVSGLINDAKLKYIKIRGKPMVQLVCQLKSTNKLVKKTFPCSSATFDDPKCISNVQNYLDSNACLTWLKRCRSRTPSVNLPIDISNISDLVDDAKLKFQNINNKPTMQLICHLTANHKTLSKNFPCSSLGPKDSECIAKIQSFVNSIDCLSWLCRFMIKNPGIEISGTDSPTKECTEELDLSSPSNLGRADQENESLLPTIKLEHESSGELSEDWVPSELDGHSHEDRVEVKSCELSLDAYNGPLQLKSPHGADEDFKSENILTGDSQLDMKNVSDLIEDVQLRYVRVDEKLKLCLLCQIKFTNISVRKYFPCSSLDKDPKVALTRIQTFINSKKILKWLSKSVSQASGKSTLDVKNIADLIEYANLKYVGTKGKPVIYLLCRLKANKKLVRKAFPCHVLGKDYVKCTDEIQNFVNSSNCRTWLTIYSGKNTSLTVDNKRENVQHIEEISSVPVLSQPEGETHSNKLNIQSISAFVDDAKVRHITIKGRRMLQLICHTKSKRVITKSFPIVSLDEEGADNSDEIQKFIDSTNCKEWLQKHLERDQLSAAKWSEGFSSEGFLDKEEHQLICSKDSKEYNSNVQNTVTPLNNEKALDVDSISHLIHSAKLIVVNIKEKYILQLLCHLKSTGELVTKNFSCSSLGFDDKDCITRIQNFIKSTECERWIRSYIPSLGIGSEKQLCTDPHKSDIVGKPEIVYVKPKTLRLICHLRNGRTKCKAFRCSSEGRNDKVAMKAIDDFLSTSAFREWICRAKGRIKSEEEWKFYGYVKTGIDTKLLVDNLTFDVNQRFFLNRKGNYEVLIHRDKHCNKETLVENSSWGTTHRLDDTYSLKETPPKNSTDAPLKTSTVAVCLLLSCASKTEECRTECGKFVRDVNIVENAFTCCGHVLQDCHCSNCYTYMTPQWCKKKDNIVLCKNCDIYSRTHGTNRPSHLWKESVTSNFRHLKCKWKLKLVLRSDDMSRWHIYRSVFNDDSHDSVVQDRKRPSLYTKDEWFSNKIRGLKDSPKLFGHKRRKRSSELIKVGSSNPDLQGNVKNIKMIKISNSIKQEIYPVDYSEENVQYLEPYEDYVQDGGVITEEIGNSADVNYQYDDEETTTQPPKKPKFERHFGTNDNNIDNSDASMVCIKCIQEKAPHVFGCSSKKEMNLHLAECHKEEPFACAACYAEDNVVVTFVDESLFKEHQKVHVAKRKT